MTTLVTENQFPSLTPIVRVTREYLENPVVESSGDVLAAVEEYYLESDVAAARVRSELEDEVDVELNIDGPRRRLLLAAINDLSVFRCIGIVDTWAAAVSVSEVSDEQDTMLQYLRRDLDELAESLAMLGLPEVSGAAVAPTLVDSVHTVARRIADESTSNVLGAMLGSLQAVLPDSTSGRALRALHRLGRIAHLNRLLEWAQRILNLALDKVRWLFGAGFDAVEPLVRTRIDAIVKVREKVADTLFAVPSLLDRCERAISDLPMGQVPLRQAALDNVSRGFNAWNLGFDIANISLKWGWRLSAVAPPVGAALAAARGVLGAGAFLVGQYYLDSPELGFLPWSSNGVRRALIGP